MSERGADGPFAAAGLDARLLAELLWLARDPPPDVPDRAERIGVDVASEEPRAVERPGTRPSGHGTGDDDEGAPAPPPVGMYSPASGRDRRKGGAATGAPMRKVAFPGASPLPNAMELARALRRFKRLTRPGRPEVDVDATVQATAEARARASDELMIRMRRPPIRSLDFALVTDTSASMRVWRPLFDRLEGVFAQLGAFRSVSRWTLGADGSTGVYLADPSGTKSKPSRLLDLSGSRIVLIATDAVAEHWYDAALWDEIDGWARAMPTTLLHMLPPDYWPDTAVGVPYTAARCTGELCPNDGFEVEWGWWAEPGPNPALPVIGLCPEDFGRWSEALVSGTAWIPGITTAAPVIDEEPDDDEAEIDEDEEQEILVDAFFQRASPGAVRLAQVLSCATTLTLPLVGVLQSQLASDTGLVERAELFVSGLLEEIGDELYAFVPAAKQRLGMGLSALDEWDISRAVNRHIENRYGVGGDFTAFVRDRDGEEAGAYVRPFAQLARTVAERRGITAPEWAELESRPPQGRHVVVDDPPRVPVAVASGQPALVPRTRTGPPVEMLAEQFARLETGELLTLLDIGQSGSTVHQVRRDETGILRATRQPTFGWADRGVSHRIEQVSGTGDVFVLATTTSETGLASAARRALPGLRPDAADLAMPGASLGAVLREAVDLEPIRQPYGMFALRKELGWGSRVFSETQPIFPAGSSRGDTTELLLEIWPSDEHGTMLVITAEAPDGTKRPVSSRSVKVPPGRYRVTAELAGPGKVRFLGLPEGEPGEFASEQMDVAKDLVYVPLGLAHLICALEYSGPERTWWTNVWIESARS
ncbi:hypothetical protein BJF79_30540 [Actinomadura sp. CNU-125]|uniref:SAV_2336 N-terminal domain-related protein n=1 Tax=Actinomadura sp. CNU-125 TaxID=1904961 RepID=UPI00095C0E55|nr:SAV_2336 N-terminal domain-related protein [Actinomadura sp. CNU-125]OLT36893.1 hypothetical protein BJF79_30540 [Actinomadura sp. CNU-125]